MKICRQSHTGLSGPATLRKVQRGSSDPTLDAIDNLPTELRAKVLSQAWTAMAAIVNEQSSDKGEAALIPCGNFDQDWLNLQNRVLTLLQAEKERALESFYGAVITVLRQDIESKRCASNL